ncbi:DUF6064 family protein [Rhizobium bangladeshense]|uniref:MFS transporter permease n=1 Tax=Rhizobium bangladeshense TaxID=1138189 RepID=A0ABS7LJ44_9HYPH|nr:DUF6064 family protein [Rhizobium bangladeshense]MBX4871168.1 hypothetical protein [Rhizobium bangladeshense]MBX4871405.1 hypothetical protein [Rhizobium bangladeshense]MBX4882719.1 hypothetical protein [Rhizobium bangladeshense]MBX4901140.1 hypothetical protein [Rhizobium bangladeshense]MBX4915227.1 hypothetical protein [Rhizobium bangladeshense]
MSEWWSYRLEDFLLFSPRVYWRMFELYNATLWPLHLPALLAGLAVILLVLGRTRRYELWMTLILAAVWTFVGWSFLWSRYAGINWAIAYMAPVFGVQALLLIAFGATGRPTCDRLDFLGLVGISLSLLTIVAYPTIAPLSGRSWLGAEVFAIAPDPTAICTLGILAAMRGRFGLLLSVIPALWLLVSGLTLHAMDEPQAVVPFLSVICILILWIAGRFTRAGQS